MTMNNLKFQRSIAVIIGINSYQGGIPALSTPLNDAKMLIEILREKHDYITYPAMDRVANRESLITLLEKTLPQQIKQSDRLLFYFAGHGIAINGEDGPSGYLIPQDAKLGETHTYLPMSWVHDALVKLNCRHFLGILDCCFAGSFRWSSTRKAIPVGPGVLHKERFDRFIQDPAWQVITSAASDQEAFDAFDLKGQRREEAGQHSPFAAALIEALEGKADIYPPAIEPGDRAGDGVTTATELYMYLRDRVEISTESRITRQTPGIHQLKKHDKGEYIFLTPEHQLNLPPAPNLDTSNNPYRGLEAFEESHSKLFFGREKLIKKLHTFVHKQPLTIVLGASGSGKSSLVRAGLVPTLKQKQAEQWHIVPPIRPGESPFEALDNALIEAHLPAIDPQDSRRTLTQSVLAWKKKHPNAKLLIFIDQTEELITLCADEAERQAFFQQILTAVKVHRHHLRVVLTLRSDFEPQVREAGLSLTPEIFNQTGQTALKSRWQDGRFIVPAMTRAELREAIEKPAEARVMYFQPHDLVEQLIDEVDNMPGALPLLSFALSELYLKYLKRQEEAERAGDVIERSLTQADYNLKIGGVIQSLTRRADKEYEKLVNDDPAYGEIIRNVMLRMVAVGGELARRKVPISELKYPDEAYTRRVSNVLKQFEDARLIVSDLDKRGQQYYEPAHDALVRGWSRLSAWQKQREKELILQRRLTPVAVEWDGRRKTVHQAKKSKAAERANTFFSRFDNVAYALESGTENIVSQILQRLRRDGNKANAFQERPEQFLWNGNPYLDALDETLNTENNWFNQTETEFVQRSVERRRKNVSLRRRIATAVFAGLSGLTILALIAQNAAQRQEQRAQRQEISALREASEGYWQSENQLESLIRGLQAAENLQGIKITSEQDKQQAYEVLTTLRKVVYATRERNRMQIEGELLTLVFNGDNKLRVVTTANPEAQTEAAKGSTMNIAISDFSGDQKLVEKAAFPLGSRTGIAALGLGIDHERFSGEDGMFHSSGTEFMPLLREFGLANSLTGRISYSFDQQQIFSHTAGSAIFRDKGKRVELVKSADLVRVIFSPENDQVLLISGSEDVQTGKLWDVSDPKMGKPLNSVIDNTTVNTADFSTTANDKWLAVGTDEGFIQVHKLSRLIELSDERNDYQELNLQFAIEGHRSQVSNILFSLDGSLLATAGDDGVVRLWDIRDKALDLITESSGQAAKTSEQMPASASETQKQFYRVQSNDQSLEASYNALEQYVNVFRNGKQVATLDKYGQLPVVNPLAFSPDNIMLAHALADGTIYLWHWEDEVLLAKFKAHESEVEQVFFSKDGNTLHTVGADGTEKAWQIGGLDQLIAQGCDWVQDYLQGNPLPEWEGNDVCTGSY